MISKQPTRILVAKPGLDGHDRGAKVVARALRDAGFEVIYTGIRQTLQEDVDGIGLSILSGAHLDLFPAIVEGLKKVGLENITIFAGGIIPKQDYKSLEELGIKGIFGPGTSLSEIVDFAKKIGT